MPRYRVLSEEDRAKVLDHLKRAPLRHNGRTGFQVTARRRTRTDEQNDLMWDLLTEFEKQGAVVEMGNGIKKTFPKEAWKVIMMNSLGHSTDMLPTLDGKSFFAEGYRSSRLKVHEMTALIEAIFAEGARQGIKFRQTQEKAA